MWTPPPGLDRNAYQVAIMLSLLPLSAVGDIFGYKRVYLAAWRSSASHRSAARSRPRFWR